MRAASRTAPCWNEQLHQALARAAAATSARETRAATAQMLSTLGDPYTRVLQPADFASFKLQNDGQLSGVGLLLAESDEGCVLLSLLSRQSWQDVYTPRRGAM
jgi:C-terminal processing protease CtpA/Prc